MKQFVIDGAAVILGVDGVPDFNALHSRKHDAEVQLCAFDIMALDGDDLRALPQSLRKSNLERPPRAPAGWHLCRSFRARRDRPRAVSAACKTGLEGLVSKRRDRPYRAGRSPHWIKVKNRKHPGDGVVRVRLCASALSGHRNTPLCRGHASHRPRDGEARQPEIAVGHNPLSGSPRREAASKRNARGKP
jgi:hypothetical protein